MTKGQGLFSAPLQVHIFDGLLSDFDGTIIDSTDAIVKHWHKVGEELGVDPKVILATSHGRRTIDTLQLYDPKRANWEYVSFVEGRIPKEFGSDAVEVPGARDLLSQLDNAGACWGVVTSGSRALIDGWLVVLNLTHPKMLVVAEDVELGKPDPRCYLLGRKRLGLEHSSSLVVLEDAPSGIRAGKAAGFKVIALATTHSLAQLQEAGADWIVEDLRSISVQGVVDGRIQLEIRNAYQ
ncbi:HAD-like domain-containing protein [Aspergillus coremiiformis]|uniref:HAD-like domain-containing protein n=1 Tax=Aspergillus coremiiformis TaxID=138285 RepID=A0A5N6YSB4_9EURO|nr:HAD-like domain-containing protein [Aspergillus coremiiformis]